MAREGVEALLCIEGKEEEIFPEQIVVEVFLQPLDSEDSEKTDGDTSDHNKIRNNSLRKSNPSQSLQ